ncbi:hypothetical protein BU15DRAFT_63138 [Melanogaster broomeanus]|nr:hypothetical protein BU15DRAFT_63138 [Melanogaster broomeanus]
MNLHQTPFLGFPKCGLRCSEKALEAVTDRVAQRRLIANSHGGRLDSRVDRGDTCDIPLIWLWGAAWAWFRGTYSLYEAHDDERIQAPTPHLPTGYTSGTVNVAHRGTQVNGISVENPNEPSKSFLSSVLGMQRLDMGIRTSSITRSGEIIVWEEWLLDFDGEDVFI